MDLQTFAQRVAQRSGNVSPLETETIERTIGYIDDEMLGALRPLIRLMPQPRKRNQTTTPGE